MSYCREEGLGGKDQVIVLTEEDLKAPITSAAVLELQRKEDDDGYEGAITDTGDINWSCPCMAGMVSGPCGFQFREAFSCFHYSTAEPKGSDCLEQFMAMRECFDRYPTVYPTGPDEGEDGGAFGDGGTDKADEYATHGRSEPTRSASHSQEEQKHS